MKIGIIGGGQLGMMMAQAALELNHEIYALDPKIDSPISKYTTKHIIKDYNDLESFTYLINTCDILTYEFENVDLNLIKKYESKFPQKAIALEKSKNRYIEKNFAKNLNIKTPNFMMLEDNTLNYPFIVKSTTGGYDGKGQYLIKNDTDYKSISNLDKSHYIVEEFINFDYEISVIATRDKHNNIAYFPIPINTHKNGILHTSDLTTNINQTIINQAQLYTKKILEELDYIGTLAVEFFVKKEQVIFNEFAPRPHNSGHYTIEGCNVSQFKNHILAITNESVIKPTLLHKTIMLNILGQNTNYVKNATNLENTYIHLYNKTDWLNNRKVGHITFIKEDSINNLKKVMR